MKNKEPKQETIEEAATNFYPPITTDLICSPKLVRDAFISGAKWQEQNSDKKYSEEELKLYGEFCVAKFNRFDKITLQNEYFEQFKKK